MADKLGVLVKTAVDDYVDGMSDSDKINWPESARLDLQKAINNEVEKWVSEIIEIDDNYTVDENAGNQIIILKSVGVTSNVTVTLPSVSTNKGRKLIFRNLNSTYKLIIQRAGSDTIEGITQFEIWADYDYSLEFFCCGDEWKRVNRQWVILKEEDRQSTWTPNGGNAVSFTVIDFGSYRALGAIALQLNTLTYLLGDGVTDLAISNIRKNGSTETNVTQLHYTIVRFLNLPSGNTISDSKTVICNCDNDGKVEYKVSTAQGRFYSVCEGFLI